LEDTRWITGEDFFHFSNNFLKKEHQNIYHESEDPKQISSQSCIVISSARSAVNQCAQLLHALKDIPNTFAQKNLTLLFVPLLINDNHWTVVCIDYTHRRVEYYDSLMCVAKEVTNCLQTYASNLGFAYICGVNKVLQEDTFQCGIWSIFFILNKIKNNQDNYNELDGEARRHMIAASRTQYTPFFQNATRISLCLTR